MGSDRSEEIERLLDKQEIQEIIFRYCRAADRGDKGLMRSLYHDDAIDDHGVFCGLASEFVEKDVTDFLPGCECSSHTVSNTLIDLNGAFAFAESYVVAYHRIAGEGGRRDLTIGGRYLDRLERRDGAWRISERRVVCDWVREDPVNGASYAERFPHRGSRDASDPLYRRNELPERGGA